MKELREVRAKLLALRVILSTTQDTLAEMEATLDSMEKTLGKIQTLGPVEIPTGPEAPGGMRVVGELPKVRGRICPHDKEGG